MDHLFLTFISNKVTKYFYLNQDCRIRIYTNIKSGMYCVHFTGSDSDRRSDLSKNYYITSGIRTYQMDRTVLLFGGGRDLYDIVFCEGINEV